jgi:hypothetical protein
MKQKSLPVLLKLFLIGLNLLIFCVSTKAQLFESLFLTEKYVVYQCSEPTKIDGIINDKDWELANWSVPFSNIEGHQFTKPNFDTKVKMLWDSKYFYIAAKLDDKNIWATMKEPESAIFEDNDFELYIDPNGDGHEYMKLEINAFGAISDIFMDMPYRDGGVADTRWTFEGIKKAVKVYGIVNRTSKKDSCWTVEIAIPWKSMIEFSGSKKIPVDGEQWRINFLRTQWKTYIKDYEYLKEKGPNKKPLPPMYWTWTPQGSLDMDQPERWGYIQFSTILAGSNTTEFRKNTDDELKWSLWQVYYLYQTYPLNYAKIEEEVIMLKNDKYASSKDFKLVELGNKRDKFLARAKSISNSGYWYINKDGKIWFQSN